MDRCIFCNNEIYKKDLCKKHYKQLVNKFYQFKKENKPKYDMKNHFHNLRFSIIRMVDYQHCIDGFINLYALAISYSYMYNDNSLIQKYNVILNKYLPIKKNVSKNIEELKNQLVENKISDFDIRNKWPRNFLCDDGHYVRSLSEMLIDNWLFSHKILHIYEKRVYLPNNPDAIIICDFYIPEKDIYIEYWGKYDSEYLSRKHAKKILYRENKINLIELDYNQIKHLDDYLSVLLKKN